MKKFITYMALMAGLCAIALSCTDKDEEIRWVEPGIYYVGKDLNSTNEARTRGITNDYLFDENYDYDYIYLHKKSQNESLYIPVHDNCENTEGSPCKGFRYRIEVHEDQSATIIPLDGNGEVYGTKKLTLNKGEKCYFSSWKSDEWALPDNQIAEGSWANDPMNETYYFYYRDKNINQEIYRSGNAENYIDLDLDDLRTNGDLFLTRACAGFGAVGLLYDKTKLNTDYGFPLYTMSEEDFKNVMEDDFKDWYIKIYLGGACFPDHYNIETGTASNEFPNGYYSSGPVDKFENGDIVGQEFLPFSQSTYGSISSRYQGFGYLSQIENLIFSPVNGGNVYIYILIKHWLGEEGTTPTTEWLTSDIGALQTTLGAGSNTTPLNSHTYTLGVVIDINEFKKAWENAGGDEAQQAAEDAVSGSTSTTRSLSGTTVREVTIPGAKVIYDVY